MSYNGSPTRSWTDATRAFGSWLATEFARLYANDNHNKDSIDNILADTTEIGQVVEDPFRRKDPARYKIVDGLSYNRADASVLMTLLFKSVTSMNSSTDRLNVPAHGKLEGDKIKLSFTAGGIVAQQEYFVRNPNPDDIQVSLTKSGAILDITADGTGEMLTNVEWGFGNGSTTYNVPDRRAKFKRVKGISGTHQKANGNYYDGGSVGETQLDKGQEHQHAAAQGGQAQSITGKSTVVAGDTASFGPDVSSSSNAALTAETFKGSPEGSYSNNLRNANGPARSGDEYNPVYVVIDEVVRVA
jgi:hypothetical protein